MSSMFKEIKFTQPDSFEFTKENQEAAKKIIAKYPKGCERSAVMPLLDLAQRQHNNWIPRTAMDLIAEMINIPPMQVYEVANFYTMYNKQPVGKYLVQVCRTTPCWLMGSDEVTQVFKEKLQVAIGETNKDFTLVEVECLGGCANGPVVQINDDYYEDLDRESTARLIDELVNEKKPKIGSQANRQCSAPKEE